MNRNPFKTILLVEDDLIDSKADKQQLESIGYSVITTNNGKTAIEIATAPESTIDLILMGIALGEGMDGIDAAVEILKTKHIPIVFLSTIHDIESIRKTENVPSYGLVAKNYNIHTLDASIKTAFRLFEANQKLIERVPQPRLSESRIGRGRFLANTAGWEMDCTTKWMTWTDNAYRLFGKEKGEFNVFFEEFVQFIHPDDRIKMSECIEEVCRSHKSAEINIKLRLHNNTEKFVHIDVEAEFDSAGKACFIHGMMQDITHRMMEDESMKMLLQEKEIMVREAHHRIKNNVGTVTSLVRLQMYSATSPETQKDLQNAIVRLESVRAVYDMLLNTNEYSAIPLRAYVEKLADIMVSIFPESERIMLRIDVGEFVLPVKKLFPVGAIINEIITNSIQHGFTGRESGEIVISIEQHENKVIMTIRDNGIGLPPDFNMETSAKFGMMIIGMLVQQLDGEFSITSDNGAVNTITFPA